MQMDIKTPADVHIQTIDWQKYTKTANGYTRSDMTDTTLQYLSTNAKLWTVSGGLPGGDECKTIYDLTVGTQTFFGTGSDWRLTHKTKTNEYEMRSSVKVKAQEDLTYSHNGMSFDYTRDIINTLPILVNLETKNVVKATFRMISTPPKGEAFVLFVSGEEDATQDGGRVIIKMRVFSKNGLYHDENNVPGVQITNGNNLVKSGSSSFIMTEETTQTFNPQGDFIVDSVTWEFIPTAVALSTGSELEITLSFTDAQHPDDNTAKWSAVAGVEIKPETLLTSIGFKTDVSIYGDRQCTTEKSEFKRGDKFFVKLLLSRAILTIADIQCSKFVVKQYADTSIDLTDVDENAHPPVVNKDMIANTDVYNFQQGGLQNENGDAIANTHVCGAELNSLDFEVSNGGYPTLVEIEVTIQYATDSDTEIIDRRMLSIPVADPWKLKNAHHYTPGEVAVAESLIKEHGQLFDYSEEAVGQTTPNKNDAETPSMSNEDALKATFMMVPDNYEFGVGVGTTETTTAEYQNYAKFGLGAAFTGLVLSLYLTNVWDKTKADENTYLLVADEL